MNIYLFKGILSDVDNDKEDECDDGGERPIRQIQLDKNRQKTFVLDFDTNGDDSVMTKSWLKFLANQLNI